MNFKDQAMEIAEMKYNISKPLLNKIKNRSQSRTVKKKREIKQQEGNTRSTSHLRPHIGNLRMIKEKSTSYLKTNESPMMKVNFNFDGE